MGNTGIQMLTQLINAKKKKKEETYVCYAKSIVFIFALSLLFVQQKTGIPFSLVLGHSLHLFPVVSFQASTERRKSLSRSLSSTGESTVWIQNDRFQVLHHHQKRYACLNVRSYDK